MKVLYVEDNPDDLDLARRTLVRQAAQISLETAASCASALERLADLQNQPLDVLLTDMRLPDGNGLSLLVHVRQQNLPLAVVVLTGSGDEESVVAALKAGADDYVVKRPGYLAYLAPVMEGALQRYRSETDRQAHPLRVLYADSHRQDMLLVSNHLAEHAPHLRLDLVNSGSEALERTLQQEYDVLLVDYHMPDLGGLDLLKELRSAGKDTPVVLVAGQSSQEAALLALRLGASDYILKGPGYLFRIPAVLESAHHQSHLRRERAALQASEERFRLLAENASDVIFRLQIQPDFVFDYVSPSLEKVTGYTPAELYTSSALLAQMRQSEVFNRVLTNVASQYASGAGTGQRISSIPFTPELLPWTRKDGRSIWIEVTTTAFYNEVGQVLALEGIARDVTERQQAAEERLRLYHELVDSYDATIAGWSRALELRDRETEGHSARVVEMTAALAQGLGVPESDWPHMRRGALLHDIGKLGIPDAILNKPGPLTEEEWAIMRQHPLFSYQLLQPVAFLAPALDIPHYHHERWDGSGYPAGLAGAAIPLAARIFAVVDVYDALSYVRSYRPAWPKEKVLAYLAAEAGRQFDPAVVAKFMEIVAGL